MALEMARATSPLLPQQHYAPCVSNRLILKHPLLLSRFVRRAGPRRRSLPRCWATIPVPESGDVVSDLGWPTTFSQHYVKGKLIGQGSFGSVYLGIDLHNGSEVAIKVMPKQRGKLTRERTLQKLMKEVGILQKMQQCRNTVRLLGCFEGNDEVMVVTQYCSGGDLQKLSDDHGGLPERAVALIAYEVLQVVEKCHELGILHGDVKPANFVLANRTKNPLFSKDINLLFGEPWLLAIDFGCSQYLGHMRFSKRTGTPVYMAPEIFDRDYHWEADMWSLGIMLYQLYARRFPYWRTYEECRHAKLDEVAVLVAESPLPMDYGPWSTMSGEGIDFMRGCLQRDYTQRMTVSQALNHPWLMQWLPEDVSEDDLSLDLSLESLATSSDDEDVLLLQQSQQYVLPGQRQPQQPQQLQQQHVAQQPPLSQLHHEPVQLQPGQQQYHQQQQPQLVQAQQPLLQEQHQVVLSPMQLQQLGGQSAERGGGVPGGGPGAYSSSSSSVASAGSAGGDGGGSSSGSRMVTPQAAAAAGNGGGITNNIVLGGSSSSTNSSNSSQRSPGTAIAEADVGSAATVSSGPGKTKQ